MIHIMDMNSGFTFHLTKLNIKPRIGEHISISITNVDKLETRSAKGKIVKIEYLINQRFHKNNITETLIQTIYIK